jgi:hypothetical protein
LIGVILADKPGLDALLAGNGRSEHLPLDSSRLFLDFANTFLRKIWHFDFQNPDANADGQNLLDKMIDGSGHPTENRQRQRSVRGLHPADAVLALGLDALPRRHLPRQRGTGSR